MSENKVLRRIFGPRRDEVTGEWKRLHNEELNDLYCSSNIVRVIKSRRMRWAGHVARMGEERGVYTYQPDLTTFLQPRHIPTQGYKITQSSAPDDGHMVARNMLSNY